MDMQAKVIHRELFRLKPMFSSICPCGGTLVSRSVAQAKVGNHHFGHREAATAKKSETMITSDFFHGTTTETFLSVGIVGHTQSIYPSLCDASS